MSTPRLTILDDPDIRKALEQAWHDSQPGIVGGHEEGGFILRDATGTLSVVRWQTGAQDTIIVPPHPNCKIGGNDILATFHTHPNTADEYLQEPSETDRRAMRDDPDLKGRFYEGEFVISQETIYLIAPNGQVSEAGRTREILGDG
ncbi:MAG: hypothetical protein HZC40_10430 [Chloroflexi bacterium]|nr:hypothetical protein [Chloroflexota bacterium]